MVKFTQLAVAAIMDGISAVIRAGSEYSQNVQDMAVQIITHAIQHGDVTLADKLVAAVRPHHKACLVAYFETNGPFRYQKQTKLFEKNKSWSGKFDPENAPHWEKAKAPPKIVSNFDVDEAFDRFVKTTRAQIEKANGVKNVALLAVLEDAQAVYNAKAMQEQAAAIIAKAKSQLEEDEVKFAPLRQVA